jgi:oxalate decarboxylase/phosphoglucose isomerase-like protein (cupin superfamily)
MRFNRFRAFAALASAGLIVLVFAGTTVGTPGSAVISAPILARGDFVDRVDVKVKFERDGNIIVANAPDAGEVAVQEVTIAPGGTTGWHSHPGPVVVVVKQGTLTYIRADGGVCTSTPYPAGTAFVDPGQGHAHTAFNLGAENLVLYATYFDVPAGGSPRIDVPVVPEPC